MKDLTERQLHELRQTLAHNRAQILQKATKQRREITTKSEESVQMPDEVDIATHLYGELLDVRLQDSERRLLKKIDAALARIASGEYGICESCDEFIGLSRLKARPTTTFCIGCKEDQEREEQTLGGRQHRQNSEDTDDGAVKHEQTDGSDPDRWVSEEDLRLLSTVSSDEGLRVVGKKPPRNAEDAS